MPAGVTCSRGQLREQLLGHLPHGSQPGLGRLDFRGGNGRGELGLGLFPLEIHQSGELQQLEIDGLNIGAQRHERHADVARRAKSSAATAARTAPT